MKPRSFTTKAEKFHRNWLSNALKISTLDGCGIDLLDDVFGIELKSRYSIHRHSFAVHEYQVELFKKENPCVELYWAFMIYDLSVVPSEIKSENIEKYVSYRATTLLEWDWVKQFSVSYAQSGPYIYIHKSDFPDESFFRKFSFSSGDISIPKNSLLEIKIANSYRG